MPKPLLSEGRPDLAAEYIDEARPADSVTLGASYAGLWRCGVCRHEWRATIASRVRGRGCPSCARFAAPGETRAPREGESIADQHPELVSQWADERPASSLTSGTHYKALWRCDVGHEWRASVLSRTQGRGKCPTCREENRARKSGNRRAGAPSLAENRPDLAALWADERPPSEVKLSSSYIAQWKCENGHHWSNSVSLQAARSHSCVVCRSVKYRRPDLMASWADERNPEEFRLSSRQKVAWTCGEGHTYHASVSARVSGNGCNICANRVIVPGVNDIATLNPELSAQLLDASLRTRLGIGSSKPVGWGCAQGHSWEASVESRVAGTGCPVCSNSTVVQGVNDLATVRPDLAAEWADDYPASQVTVGSAREARWMCASGHTWTTRVYGRGTKGTGCPDCSARQFVSSGEREIVEYLHQFFSENEVQTSVRSLRKHGIGELDIYLPEKNIAIEVNGVYWHSEAAGKSASYHLEKYEACQALGIRLIQIWEDDWTYRRDIVERMLAHKLGVSQEPVIAARKTTATAIDKAEAQQFLGANHIQGWVRGSLYLGLRHGEELVAVMVLTYSNNEARLERYATCARVPGGQSKLLAYAERVRPWARLITFADHEVSDGNLYEKTGWTAEKVLRPDYRYVVGGRRVHKFNYRLARFRSDPNLEYVEGLSERELAALNKLHRVWDSGKTRYVKTV